MQQLNKWININSAYRICENHVTTLTVEQRCGSIISITASSD